MPDQTLSDLFQRAVIWPFLQNDGYGGPVVDIAFEIACRWLDKQSNMMNPKRETITVDARVRVGPMPATVNQTTAPRGNPSGDIPMDSLIWLGSLADLQGTAGPGIQTPAGLFQVKAINSTPDIDNRFVSRTIGVVRFRGSLPSLPGGG